MVDIIEKQKCCGCTACMNICPKKSIEMKMDEEGFFYPIIDENTCIHCGRCDAVCPMNNITMQVDEITPVAYAAKSRYDDIRYKSSSGGVFTFLAEKVLSCDGVVYGVEMTQDMENARHIRITTSEELDSIRGSKYIYSMLGNTFISIKDDLLKGKKVLFSGTPCQVWGLKDYLGKEYSNLICVDLICHGIPSQLVWEKYLTDKKQKFRRSIKNISFRSKLDGWREFGQEFKLKKGKNKFYPKYYDYFLRIFLSDCCLRPSCYECLPKLYGYKSDITLGDFWSITRVNPEFDDGKGVSIVIPHTYKGIELIESLSSEIEYIAEDYESSIRGNSVREQTIRPSGREMFFYDLNHMSVKQLADKYSPISFKGKIKITLQRLGLIRFFGGAKGIGEYGMLFKLD